MGSDAPAIVLAAASSRFQCLPGRLFVAPQTPRCSSGVSLRSKAYVRQSCMGSDTWATTLPTSS
eukprot:12758247-Alexandrium_andersonii.AAC.1